MVDIAVTPEGTEHSFDDLLTHAVIDPTEGWLRLLPGATAGLMALSGNPAKIATVLRAHKAAFAWQGPELPHAYDPEWLQGVTRAVVAARANPVLCQTRGIGSLVTGGFGQDAAFGFLPFDLKAPSSNFQLPQQ